MRQRTTTIDGNEAAAYISYPFTEVAAIYPITPSSPMAEHVDVWSANGNPNFFEQPVRVVEMQSEAGAAGTLHGSLASGALTTTYTAAQGLLLMIPTMYKLVGELWPAVFHVSARALATHALSIFGDHQDVMACRQTGFVMLASDSVQEVMDLGAVAHLAAIRASLPVLHFFDGFRTSHEVQKISLIDYADLKKLIDWQALTQFRRRSLNPNHPVIRGTAQNPDIYFQGREVANPFFERVPHIVQDYMDRIAKLTGRQYHLFDYYGSPDAEKVIVAMGSVCETIDETIDYLRTQGEKVGAVRVRLYRPFAAENFRAVLPQTVRKIAVLDRTKEPGSLGEPLYLDVANALRGSERYITVVGGRYGLGSKDTTPGQIVAVVRNLDEDQPKHGFTIGIEDDVSHTSLPEQCDLDLQPEGVVGCKFWGLGSDGTVGANKAAIKLIGDHTNFYAQGYFYYDSKKSGGTTISHLRFGRKPIRSTYLVNEPDFVACHNRSFLYNYDLVKGLRPRGTFVLNCPWKTIEEFDRNLPAGLRRYIAENDIRFFVIDALAIAGEVGLGNRINMVMQAAFFKLMDIIPLEEAVRYLKEAVEETYGSKGREIVEMNFRAIEKGVQSVKAVDVPDSWKGLPVPEKRDHGEVPDFIHNIQAPISSHEGDSLPVSAFVGREDGSYPLGTTAYEKRGIAVQIPQWQLDKCIQCNQCSFVCPHAVIRPLLLNEEEKGNAPKTFNTKKAVGRNLEGLSYRIQISPLDCTGCGNCADICPAPGKALIMQSAEQEIREQADNWEYGLKVSRKDGHVDRFTLKGSQFFTPLFEFHGACPGCGETPYIRLLTQLFGERMVIANATGCSSIYGGSVPSFPYSTNASGQGPAWANSLFENNAEFGYGIFLGAHQKRLRIRDLLTNLRDDSRLGGNREVLQGWIDDFNQGRPGEASARQVVEVLTPLKDSCPNAAEVLELADYLVKHSQWLIGGDGWAYDIGFGGLDHVLALGDDVNALVLDTEVYSNTGGQASKATPTGATAKFAASGKRVSKKELGLMAMTYGYVYVAQVSLGANMNHTLRTLLEAESYPGPSLIIAYSPCISHGIRRGMGTSIRQEKFAVECGHWPLYRYNPLKAEKGENPFSFDSPKPEKTLDEFIRSELRFSSLENTFPEQAEKLFELAEQNAERRQRNLAEMQEEKREK